MVGDAVGVLVGTRDGADDGMDVGDILGSGLGRDVGGGVGASVGNDETVGENVGWSKTSPAATQRWSACGAVRPCGSGEHVVLQPTTHPFCKFKATVMMTSLNSQACENHFTSKRRCSTLAATCLEVVADLVHEPKLDFRVGRAATHRQFIAAVGEAHPVRVLKAGAKRATCDDHTAGLAQVGEH